MPGFCLGAQAGCSPSCLFIAQPFPWCLLLTQLSSMLLSSATPLFQMTYFPLLEKYLGLILPEAETPACRPPPSDMASTLLWLLHEWYMTRIPEPHSNWGRKRLLEVTWFTPMTRQGQAAQGLVKELGHLVIIGRSRKSVKQLCAGTAPSPLKQQGIKPAEIMGYRWVPADSERCSEKQFIVMAAVNWNLLSTYLSA